MKAAHKTKLEGQVSATGAELRVLLGEALPYTAEIGDSLLFNSQLRPVNIGPHQISERSEALFSMAAESVAVREQVG